MTGSSDGDDVALAGEYALGVLTPADTVAFERRLDGDARLRATLAEWHERLAGMLAHVPPVLPPQRLEREVLSRLFPHAARPRARWRHPFAPLAAGAALALGLVLAAPFLPIPGGAEAVATVAAEDGSLRVAARFDADTDMLLLVREAGAPRPGRALELWLIPEETSPVSLGVLPARSRSLLHLTPALVAAMEGGTLAISDEPAGGSPTGSPTGEVLAVGLVQAA